jgi:hypothetical protein
MFKKINAWIRRALPTAAPAQTPTENCQPPTANPPSLDPRPLDPRPSPPTVHHVLASSFADPADVAAFHRCKKTGKSDQECFKVGDNGIGCWGDPTTGTRPMCALPREDWALLGPKARGAKVRVSANGRVIICELRDTMPSRKNITNKCGIDLNPAACQALQLIPPMVTRATWSYV